MRSAVYMSRPDLERLRDRRLQAQIRHCAAHVPFYRDTLRQLGLAPAAIRQPKDLRQLPVITKAMIRSDPRRFKALHLRPPIRFRSHSSGSTGEPLWTEFDLRAWWRRKFFAKLRARLECGWRPGQRMAVLDCVADGRFHPGGGSARVQTNLMRVGTFSIFGDAAILLARLQAFQPISIYGFPSALFRLAEIAEDRNQGLPGLKRIFTSSEYLSPNVRSLIQRVFAAPVFDIYGCTEVKEIAWQCERREGYHINEDDLICEIVVGDRPAEPGEEGEVVVTDLLNRAMPLIRYRVGDRALRLDRPCRCGRAFALMRPCAGRASDDLVLPDGRRVSPYAVTTAIEHVSGLRQYQVVQDSPQRLTVRIIAGAEVQLRVGAEIQRILNDVLGAALEIRIEVRPRIDPEENGKFKVIVGLPDAGGRA